MALYHPGGKHRGMPVEAGMWGCRTAQAPVPDKDEMLDDMRSVTPQERKWIRSNAGSMHMRYYAIQTRWDMKALQ